MGQNVNSYYDQSKDFPDLLQLIDAQTQIKRIRFLTSHPMDFSFKLIQAIADLLKVCEHIHLPLQAGSDKILKRMNRKYTKGEYLGLVNKAKESIENLSLTTDLIVGFPGETETDFQQTLDMVRACEFDSAFMFRYSPRGGTKAAQWENDVPEKEKLRRLQILIGLQKEISYRKNKKLIGEIGEVLIEEKSRSDQNKWKGKSRNNKTVIIEDHRNLSGEILKVRITDAYKGTLLGKSIS